VKGKGEVVEKREDAKGDGLNEEFVDTIEVEVKDLE
jgi:hypothetical protein